MQPDAQLAMQAALAHGPGHCPPDLFAGEVPAIVRGLKVHANQINHARHEALEESYPRLRERMGAEAFHRAAERHLARPQVLGRSLDRIGEDLAALLTDAAHRDLARVEWAWLTAYHAADREALSPSRIACMAAEALLLLAVARHPAAQLVIAESDGDAILITRPEATLQTATVTPASAALFDALERPQPLGDLLARAAYSADLLALISAGALMIAGDQP